MPPLTQQSFTERQDDYLKLAREFEDELTLNILPYWIKHAPNGETGGFHGEVSIDNIPDLKAHRAALLSTRILWTFSSAYGIYKDASYLKIAERAFSDLETTFWDETYGGIIWSTTSTGEPLRSNKQIYVQAFAIYGYSEYYRVSRDEKALSRAKRLYELIETHAFDPLHGGYIEWLSADWSQLPPNQENYLGDTTRKTQNTQLHVFEAYTNLLRVWPDEGLRTQLKALVEILLSKILNPRTNHLGLYFDDDWSVVGDDVSFGHDIEVSWLLVDTAKVLDDADLIKRTSELALAIASTTILEGVDPADGGIYMGASASRGLTNAGKDWWSQAEALVGFINAFEISGGEQTYLDALKKTWVFVKSVLVRREGEWLWGVEGEGNKSDRAVISEWKCPYHNGRAMLEGVRRLRELAATGKDGE